MGIKEWWLIGRIIHLLIYSWRLLVDFINKYFNRIKWIFIYYIKRDKTRKYIIDSRISKNIIYCDGHFVFVNEYNIFMLSEGNFIMEKGFNTSNPEHVDFTTITDSPTCDKNRFNSYIVKAEPMNKKTDGNLQITNLKKEKRKVSFNVELDARSTFESFSFGLYLSIPKEFTSRINLDDEISINDHIYGKFILELKIDKDSPHIKYFAPTIIMNKKYKKPEISEDLFYLNRKWNLKGLFTTLDNIKITHKK